MARTLIVWLIVTFLFSGCKNQDTSPSTSFYYWRTVFQLSPDEQELLSINNVRTLYIRYFDIALRSGEPVPQSTITFKDIPSHVSVIPVIYIKNEVMKKKGLDVQALAQKVSRYITQINNKHHLRVSEIQLDCDWTESSKDNYFHFLSSLKTLTQKHLSATIRLHQVKYYRNTGIPPVDKGILMYYNMGVIASDSSNSIYEQKTALKYVENLKQYPLALDVALPVFSWGIQVRHNKVIALLNKVNEHSFTSDSHFIRTSPAFYKVRERVIRMGYYFEQDDLIKIESITADDIEEMANDLSTRLAQKPRRIIFYDLDHFNITPYSHEKNFFQEISSHF
jgi:hypothetical protein